MLGISNQRTTESFTSVKVSKSLSVTGACTLAALTVNGAVTGTSANFSGIVTAPFITGTLLTASQPNITSVGTLTSLAVANGIVAASANLSGILTASSISGTLITASQPNITSLGTIGSLAVTSSITLGGNAVKPLVAYNGGAIAATGRTFASLPSATIRQITIRFFNVKTTANTLWASGPYFQLADSGNYTTPVYNGVVQGNNAGSYKAVYSNGWPLWNADSGGNYSSAFRFSGVMRLYRTGDEWFVDGTTYRDDIPNIYNATTSVRVLLGTTGLLTELRLINGGATFDTGVSGYMAIDYL